MIGLIVLLVWLPMLSIASETPAEEILWIDFDTPPLYIHSGAYLGQGGVQQTRDYFIQHLSQFRHRIERGSLATFFEFVQHHDHDGAVCNAAMLKSNERERFVAFSLPVYFTFGHHLVVK